MVKFILFDLTYHFPKSAKKIFNREKNKFIIRDIKEILLDSTLNIDYIVSPANSHGYMDGGIDGIYMDIFEGIEPRVESEVASLETKNLSGEGYLSISSCLVVNDICNENTNVCNKNISLLCVPTMYHPQDIRETDNILCFLIYLSCCK